MKIQRRAVLRHVIFPNFGNGLEVNVAQRTSVNYPYSKADPHGSVNLDRKSEILGFAFGSFFLQHGGSVNFWKVNLVSQLNNTTVSLQSSVHSYNCSQ